jgi:hypothetical protein
MIWFFNQDEAFFHHLWRVLTIAGGQQNRQFRGCLNWACPNLGGGGQQWPSLPRNVEQASHDEGLVRESHHGDIKIRRRALESRSQATKSIMNRSAICAGYMRALLPDTPATRPR